MVLVRSMACTTYILSTMSYRYLTRSDNLSGSTRESVKYWRFFSGIVGLYVVVSAAKDWLDDKKTSSFDISPQFFHNGVWWYIISTLRSYLAPSSPRRSVDLGQRKDCYVYEIVILVGFSFLRLRYFLATDMFSLLF